MVQPCIQAEASVHYCFIASFLQQYFEDVHGGERKVWQGSGGEALRQNQAASSLTPLDAEPPDPRRIKSFMAREVMSRTSPGNGDAYFVLRTALDAKCFSFLLQQFEI